MSRLATLIFLILAASLLILAGCDDDEDDYSDFDCNPPIDFLYDCGFTATFDDVNPVSRDEAYDSCQYSYGAYWKKFVLCWKDSESCEQLTDCIPKHGFFTDDDDDDDNDDDNDDNNNDDDNDNDTSAGK